MTSSPDLIEELLRALEPYDYMLVSFTDMRSYLRTTVPEFPETRLQHDRLLSAYLSEQVRARRDDYGHEEADRRLTSLIGLSSTLLMAGRLTENPLTGQILIFAAHLSALTSYGEAPWINVSKIILAAQVKTTEKELARSRR